MAVTNDQPAPYAPPATIMDVIRRFRDRGMQTPFNGEVLGRAGVAESLIPRTLQSLRILDLIDEAGNPSEALRGLAGAPESEFQPRLADWLRAAYAEVFQYVDPATDTPDRVRDAFRAYEPRGQHARMVTLFLTLCQEAGIRNTEEAGPRRRATQQRGGASRSSGARVAGDRKPPSSSQSQPVSGLPQPIAGLLASLPVDGRWTKERRDDFIKTFQAVIDFCIEVVSEDAVAQKGDDDE